MERSVIKQVNVPYVDGTGSGGSVKSGINGLSVNIFLLSGYEVGFSKNINKYIPIDGVALSYFEEGDGTSANNKRIAYLDGTAEHYSLRSPSQVNTESGVIVQNNGQFGNGMVNGAYGIRPALILPSNALFDKNTLILKGVS